MDLVPAHHLGIPVDADLVEEDVNQLHLGVDDFKVVRRLPDASCEVLVSDRDGSDEPVVPASVRDDIFILALEAVEEGGDRVMLRIWKKRSSGRDCRAERWQEGGISSGRAGVP